MKKQPVRTSSVPRTITPVVLVKVTGGATFDLVFIPETTDFSSGTIAKKK